MRWCHNWVILSQLKKHHKFAPLNAFSDRTIISAGHCVYYVDSPLTFSWLVGSHSIEDAKRTPGSIYNIYNIELHPKWVNDTVSFDDYDIVLITLDRKIRFNEHVKPICLPSINGEEPFYGKRVIVAGWGKVSLK